jgi:Galactose oxidase, central domain
VSHHQSVAILNPLKKYNHLYRGEDSKNDRLGMRNPFIVEGMFVFGGIDHNDDLLSNDIWVLKVDSKPMTWIKLDSKGQAPGKLLLYIAPRFGHSMNFMDKLGVIVVHGGSNHLNFLSKQLLYVKWTHTFFDVILRRGKMY